MLYFGVDFNEHNFKISILTESFAHLDTKVFYFEEKQRYHKWLDSFKDNCREKCSWYFDEFDFINYENSASNFYYDNSYYEIYLVNHRKLLNIIQFLYEWAIHNESVLTFDIEKSLLLASAIRLFDDDDIKSYTPADCPF
ncbi:MAG: hypothetical protein KKD01_19955 [Proteobacteria bacterium]|nr:hypothetical protein [Pseudomonadota bacterium]